MIKYFQSELKISGDSDLEIFSVQLLKIFTHLLSEVQSCKFSVFRKINTQRHKTISVLKIMFTCFFNKNLPLAYCKTNV